MVWRGKTWHGKKVGAGLNRRRRRGVGLRRLLTAASMILYIAVCFLTARSLVLGHRESLPTTVENEMRGVQIRQSSGERSYSDEKRRSGLEGGVQPMKKKGMDLVEDVVVPEEMKNFVKVSRDNVVFETWDLVHAPEMRPGRKVCRVSPACWSVSDPQLSGGSDVVLRLPPVLRPYQHLLRQCGVVNLAFVEKTSDFPDTVLNYDLLTTRVQRVHFPHFLSDFISAMVGWNVLDQQPSSRISLSPTNSTAALEKGRSRASLRPAVLVNEAILDSMLPTAWVRQFLNLKPSPKPLGVATTNGTCFRSAVIASGSPGAIPPGFLADVDFFRENNVEKSARGSCPQVITLVDRKSSESATRGRYIFNRDKLVAKLQEIIPNSKIQIADLSNHTFSEQIEIFYRSDAIVSVHGAEMTNTVWTRTDAPVVELMPFRYEANIFEDLARMLGLKHRAILSEPDETFLRKCLNFYYPKETKPEAFEASERALAKFDDWAKEWRTTRWQTKSPKLTAELRKLSIDPIRMFNACIREQRIIVDPEYVAKTVASLLPGDCRR